MEKILFGSVREAGKLVTPKQKKFVEKIVLEGKNKTQAYRESYNTKGKRSGQSSDAQRISRKPAVVLYMQAVEKALEVQKYQTPAHLRALVIHQLTEHAISDDIAPAQRLKALQLLGNITEVAAFTERREVVQVKDANSARDQLMAAIREAVTANATDAQVVDADSLLAELAGPANDADQVMESQEQAQESEPPPAETIADGETHPPATP